MTIAVVRVQVPLRVLLKTPLFTGVFAFLEASFLIMKKDKKDKNAPRNVPAYSVISLEISMAQKRWSQPKLYIPRVNGKPSVAPGKRWYV